MTHDVDASDRPSRLHRECWEQIPWIANGALAADQYALLEPHLRACEACQHELALQERMRMLVRRDDAVTLAPQAGWQKLMQRIDAEDAASEPQTEPAPAPFARPTHWRRWAAIAATGPVVALALALGAQHLARRDELTAPRFETLTADNPIAANGPVIRLVFREDVALQDMNALLRTVDAQIIAGPSEAGVYTIALAGPPRADHRIDAALARLRADPRVVFAEGAVTRSAP